MAVAMSGERPTLAPSDFPAHPIERRPAPVSQLPAVAVPDSGLDVVRGEAEQTRNLIVAPTLLQVIHHVIDGNTSPLNFWPATAIDNLCAHGLLSQ